MTALLVPERFNGPPASGNGGWTAGALAAALVHPDDRCTSWPTVTVALHRPPPLAVALPVVERDGWAVALQDEEIVGRARRAEHEPVLVESVPVGAARAAESSYAGLTSHPFPTCFACGTSREEGDGLRIFPGRVDDAADGTARLAATWTPHPSTAEDWHAYADIDGTRHASLPVTWAALDCIGGWAGDLTERLMVLGTMTTRVDTLPVIGEEHVLVGCGRRREGRKTFTATTLYDADGRVVASAEHVWIAVDPADFG